MKSIDLSSFFFKKVFFRVSVKNQNLKKKTTRADSDIQHTSIKQQQQQQRHTEYHNMTKKMITHE